MAPSIPTSRRVRQSPRDPAFVADPYRFYARLHAAGDPLYWEDYGLWCLAGFDAVSAALRERRLARVPPPEAETTSWPDHLADFAAAERHSLLALEPPAHTRLRRRVNRAFIAREVRRLEPEVRALAEAGAERLRTRGRADLIETFATPLPVTVIARLIGVPERESDDLLAWSHAMVRVYTMTQSHAEELAANAAARAFRERLLALLDAKRERPSDDLLSRLLEPGENGETLADEEIVSLAILLLNAGHEATVHQIGNAARTLLARPPDAEPAAALFADPARRERTVTELLRHDPPLHLFVRHAQEEYPLGAGITLAPGERVALLLGAANRDPARFREPDRFDPERADGAQLALGAGVHHCVGAPLARLELGVALGTLFARLPALRIDGETPWRDSFHFRGLAALPVSC